MSLIFNRLGIIHFIHLTVVLDRKIQLLINKAGGPATDLHSLVRIIWLLLLLLLLRGLRYVLLLIMLVI